MTQPDTPSLRTTVESELHRLDLLSQLYDKQVASYNDGEWACDRYVDEGSPIGRRLYQQTDSALNCARAMLDFNRDMTGKLGQHPMASWATLRPVLELSLIALWVLTPEERNTRFERTLRWANDSVTEGVKFATALGDRDYVDDLSKEKDTLNAEASQRELQTPIKAMMKTTDIAISLASDVHGAETYWRLLSGLDHGNPIARDTAWTFHDDGSVQSDELIYLGALLGVVDALALALWRFLERMGMSIEEDD